MSYIFPFFFKRAGRGQLGRGHRDDVMHLSRKTRWGGGGVRARGGDLTNFKIFGSKSPGWETKGQSIVSKKTPSQGKKSKQTIL